MIKRRADTLEPAAATTCCREDRELDECMRENVGCLGRRRSVRIEMEREMIRGRGIYDVDGALIGLHDMA